MSKRRRGCSVFLLVLALALSAATAALCAYAPGAETIIIGQSGDPALYAEEFLEKAFSGAVDEAEALCTGGSFGMDMQDDDQYTAMLKSALRDSFSFERLGQARQNGTTATVDFGITYLDLPSLTALQKELTEARLARYVEEAEFAEDVLNEDGSYREDVALAALEEITQELLSSAGDFYVQTQLSLTLVYSGGDWLIKPDEAFFRILSGNTAY